MITITVKDDDGNRLAAGNSVAEVVQNLVLICEDRNRTLKAINNFKVELAGMPPDMSATAFEHRAVYSAGWLAARRAALDLAHDTLLDSGY